MPEDKDPVRAMKAFTWGQKILNIVLIFSSLAYLGTNLYTMIFDVSSMTRSSIDTFEWFTVLTNLFLLASILFFGYRRERLNKEIVARVHRRLQPSATPEHHLYLNRNVRIQSGRLRGQSTPSTTFIYAQSQHALPLWITPKTHATPAPLHLQLIPTGDREFDDKYHAYAPNESYLRHYISPQVRTFLLAQYDDKKSIYLQDQNAVYAHNSILSDPEEAFTILDQHSSLLDLLEERHAAFQDTQLQEERSSETSAYALHTHHKNV